MFFRPAILIMSNVVFEANFILATVHSNQNTQTSVMTSVPSLKTQEPKHNLTAQDKKDLESMDWDNNFDMEIKANNKTIVNNVQNNQSQHEEDEVLTIPDSPESPRSKKMKFLFHRCLDETYRNSQLDSQEVVIAGDSDGEK